VDGFPFKEHPGLEFDASFTEAGRWSVTPAQFRRIELTEVGTHKAKLFITLQSTANGSFDVAAGKLDVRGSFSFKVKKVASWISVLEVTLDGGSYQLSAPPAVVAGKPIAAGSGAVALAGKGRFVGGRDELDGRECLVLIEGTFDPLPW
jgi:hypothetical protein